MCWWAALTYGGRWGKIVVRNQLPPDRTNPSGGYSGAARLPAPCREQVGADGKLPPEGSLPAAGMATSACCILCAAGLSGAGIAAELSPQNMQFDPKRERKS